MSSFIIPGRKPVIPTATVTPSRSGFVIPKRTTGTAAGIMAPIAPTFRSQILTGPYISTQERATAAKNVLTSVTQRSTSAPFVIPKPIATPKPVVQRNLTPLFTPKPVVPFQSRPLVTPIEQQKRIAAAPAIVTKYDPHKYNPEVTPVAPLPIAETVKRWSAEAAAARKATPAIGQRLLEGMDSFTKIIQPNITPSDPGRNTVADFVGSIATVAAGVYAVKSFLSALSAGVLYLKTPRSAIDRETTTLFPSFSDSHQAQGYVLKLQQTDPASAAKFKSDLITLLSQTMEKDMPTNVRWTMVGGKLVSHVVPVSEQTLQETANRMYDFLVSNGQAGSFATVGEQAASAMTATSNLVAAVNNPQTSLVVAEQAANQLAKTGLLPQLSSAFARTIPTPAIGGLGIPVGQPTTVPKPVTFLAAIPKAVPVGQPVTTRQTVAPAPVRTAIPAQATAPLSRILPHVTETPAVPTPAPTRFVIPARTTTQPAISSPVANIPTRQPSVSIPTVRILPRVQAEATQPIPRAQVVPYTTTLPDGSTLTITPPAAKAPTVQVTPAAEPTAELQPPSFREWRYVRTSQREGKLVPNGVGQKFTPDQITTLRKWITDNGMSVNYNGATATGIAIFDQNALTRPLDLSLYGKEGVRREQSALLTKQSADKDVARKAELASKATSRVSYPWIQSTFGDALGVANSSALSDVLEGTVQKFNGVVSEKWIDGLAKIGAITPENTVDWTKLKNAYVSPAAVTPTVATDLLTGLGTPEALKAADTAGKTFVSVDPSFLLTGIKKFGPEFGDTLRVALAAALKQEGIDAYHVNKVETAALFATPEEADAKMAAVQKDLADVVLHVDVNGKRMALSGLRWDYGIGDDKQSADADLAATKSDLAGKGLQSQWTAQSVGSPAVTAEQRQGNAVAANLALNIRPEAAVQQQIAKNNATPWAAEGRQPTPRELLNGVVAMGYTLSDSSRQMFDTKEINKLPMLQKLFRKSGTKVIGLDDLASRLFSEYGIDRPQGDMQDDDWLAQQLVAGASKGAGNATKDLFGGEIRTRAVAPTEAQDTELFGKGQKAAFNTQQINAAERGRHLQGQNQRTEQVRQAPVDEGILAGEVAGLPFDALNGNLGTNANVTGTQANQPTTAGYEMNVTPPSGTTARTIAAENIQKVALAVKDYVTTLASHPEMKETDYHAKLQERLDQLGVPAGLFTPTQILSMYQASKGPSQLWNLTNRVLMKLNEYNNAQDAFAKAMNSIPSRVFTKTNKATLQDDVLDGRSLEKVLDIVDRAMKKDQVASDLREKFDEVLADVRTKVSMVKQAEREKVLRKATIAKIDRNLKRLERNVRMSHNIDLSYVDSIRTMMAGKVDEAHNLTTEAINAMTTDDLTQLYTALREKMAEGSAAWMAKNGKQTAESAIQRLLPQIKGKIPYETAHYDKNQRELVTSRFGQLINWAQQNKLGNSLAATVWESMGLGELYSDVKNATADAKGTEDMWTTSVLDAVAEAGVTTQDQAKDVGIWLIDHTKGGRQHLVNGNGMSEEELNALTLTPEEQVVADIVQKHWDKMFPVLRDYCRDVLNIELSPIDAYTSLMNAPEYGDQFERAMDNVLAHQEQIGGNSKKVSTPMAKLRTGGNNPVETNILRVIRNYDHTVARAQHLGPVLKEWWPVLNDQRIQDKLGKLGSYYATVQLVNATYDGGPGGRLATNVYDHIFNWLRKGASVAQILGKIPSAFVQGAEIVNAVPVAGAGNVLKASVMLATDRKYGEWVKENFPLLRNTAQRYFEIIEMPQNKITNVLGWAFKMCHYASRTSAAIANYMAFCQHNNIPIDWDHPDRKLLQKAQEYVDKEFGPEDEWSMPASLSIGFGFGGSKSLGRTIMQYQQDTIARINLLEELERDGWKEKNPAKMANGILWLIIVSTAVIAAIRYGNRKAMKAIFGANQTSDTFLDQVVRDSMDNIIYGNVLQAFGQYGDLPIPALGAPIDLFASGAQFLAYKSAASKLKAGIRVGTDVGTLLHVPAVGLMGQIAGYMVPSGSTSSGSTTTKATRPSKPTPTFTKPHK